MPTASTKKAGKASKANLASNPLSSSALPIAAAVAGLAGFGLLVLKLLNQPPAGKKASATTSSEPLSKVDSSSTALAENGVKLAAVAEAVGQTEQLLRSADSDAQVQDKLEQKVNGTSAEQPVSDATPQALTQYSNPANSQQQEKQQLELVTDAQPVAEDEATPDVDQQQENAQPRDTSPLEADDQLPVLEQTTAAAKDELPEPEQSATASLHKSEVEQTTAAAKDELPEPEQSATASLDRSEVEQTTAAAKDKLPEPEQSAAASSDRSEVAVSADHSAPAPAQGDSAVSGKAAAMGPTGESQKVYALVRRNELEVANEVVEPLTSIEVEVGEMVATATQQMEKKSKASALSAEKLQLQALELAVANGARDRIIAEVASGLADITFQLGKMEETKAVLDRAIQASQAADYPVLEAKLMNNLGAVLRKLDQYEEAEKLHCAAYDRARVVFGSANNYAVMARTNLVDCLQAVGKQAAALSVLQEAADGLLADADQPSVAMQGSQNIFDRVEVPARDKDIDVIRNQAIRALMEVGKQHDRMQQNNEAEDTLRKAVQLTEEWFGRDDPTSAAPLAALGQCLSKRETPEGLSEAVELFATVQKLTEQVRGFPDENNAMALATLSELCSKLERNDECVLYAEKSLSSMQGVLGNRPNHPLLESFWKMVAEAKQRAGDEKGAAVARRSVLKCRPAMQQQTQQPRGGPRKAGKKGKKK